MAKKKGRKVSSSRSGGGSEDAILASGGDDNGAAMDVADAAPAASKADADQGGTAWVLARVLDLADGDAVPRCRADGCDKAAVKVWTKTARPDDDIDDEFPMCEACGAKSCEGVAVDGGTRDIDDTTTPPPEAKEFDDIGVTPSPAATEGDDEAQEPIKSEAAPSPEAKAGDDGAKDDVDDGAKDEDGDLSGVPVLKADATTTTTTDPEEVENEGSEMEDVTATDGVVTEEAWELRRILSVKDITETATTCSNPKCKTLAACVYVSNLAPDDDWYSCLDCQDVEFGGFPPADELPLTSMSDDHLQIMAKHCSRKKNPTMPVFEAAAPPSSAKTPGKASHKPDLAMITPTAPPDAEEDGEEDDEVEVWDLKRIFSVNDIKDCPIKCSSDACALPAACVWVSNQAPTVKWYSCLDCQAKDFGGWPPRDELPVPHLAKEHMDFLVQKCSRNKSIDMPDFGAAATTITASPGGGGGTNARATTHSLVTPLPGGLSQDGDDDDDEEADDNQKPPPQPAKQQPSKQALAMHQKWQEAAVALGGKDSRIVVSKPKAKPLIFELLENAYRPMNITEIHKELKAIVPAPVLKACLDEMADGTSDERPTFDDSDDEDDGKKAPKKSKAGESGNATNDPFKASLCLKAGKSPGSSLYYVDYNKLKNNGNGLDPHERNELAAALANAQAEEAAQRGRLKQFNDETTQLLSEPTNVEIVARLETDEAALQVVKEKVEVGRMHKANEKHRIKLKKAIDSMAAQWRKRRRICMDFLITMEESSDGSMSMKKCLAGDGPVDVDSDEAVAKAAVAYAAKKRSAPAFSTTKGKAAGVSKKLKVAPGGRGADGPLANEDFVAVVLNSQGLVSRVLATEDTK